MNDWKIRINQLSGKQVSSILLIVGFVLFLVGMGLWFFRLNSLGLNLVEAFTIDLVPTILFLIPIITGIVLLVIAAVIFFLEEQRT
jgi:hypothetical protein